MINVPNLLGSVHILFTRYITFIIEVRGGLELSTFVCLFAYLFGLSVNKPH